MERAPHCVVTVLVSAWPTLNQAILAVKVGEMEVLEGKAVGLAHRHAEATDCWVEKVWRGMEADAVIPPQLRLPTPRRFQGSGALLQRTPHHRLNELHHCFRLCRE